MKKGLIVLIVLILLIHKLLAQSGFQEGFILRSATDTIYGLIDNKNYFLNSQYCDFRKGESTEVTRYYPSEIFGYRFVNGKFYLAKTIDFDDQRSTLFLEYIINGKIDIYFLQDKNYGSHFFASKDSLPLYELHYFEGVMEVGGKQVAYQNKNYMGILKYLTADYPQMESEISKIEEPSQDGLSRFAKKYQAFACPDEKCIIYEKKLQRHIKLSGYIGPQYFFMDGYPSKNSEIIGKKFTSFGFNVLIQQAQQHENIYLGIGFNCVPNVDDGNIYRIPFTINYIKSKNGFTPIFSTGFDILQFPVGSSGAGLKYQNGNFSFTLSGEINTILLFIPYGASVNAGLIVNLR